VDTCINKVDIIAVTETNGLSGLRSDGILGLSPMSSKIEQNKFIT